MTTLIEKAEVLEITGADAIRFAHSQFTNAVTELQEGTWQWSAWLNAQGKVRHFFALFHPAPNTLLIWLPRGSAETMRNKLSFFILRSKVILKTLNEWSLYNNIKNEPPNHYQIRLKNSGFEFQLPGNPARCALLSPTIEPHITFNPSAQALWHQADIQSGLPFLAPMLSEEFVPQALNLERIQAIHFQKGCYPGQEIAARLHFRGGNKRTLTHIIFPENTPPPETGSYLYLNHGTEKAGRILYSVATNNSQALAVLTDTALVHSTLCLADGIPINAIHTEFICT